MRKRRKQFKFHQFQRQLHLTIWDHDILFTLVAFYFLNQIWPQKLSQHSAYGIYNSLSELARGLISGFHRLWLSNALSQGSPVITNSSIYIYIHKMYLFDWLQNIQLLYLCDAI